MKLTTYIKKLQTAFKKQNSNSKTAYINRFKRVYNNVEDINDPKKVMKFIKSISIGSQSPTLRGFVKCLEALKLPVDKIYIDLRREVALTEKNKKVYENKLDDSKIQGFSYSQVGEAYNKLKDSNDVNDILSKWIIASFHLIGPLRPSEFSSSLVVLKDAKKYKKLNRLIIEEKKLIIMNHKTDKHNKEKEINLCDEYIELVKGIMNIYSPKYIFSSLKNPEKEIDRKTIQRYTKKHFKLSPNDLRNIYVSERIDNPNVSMKDRLKDCHVLGHSMQTEDRVYSKYSRMLHGDVKDKIGCIMQGMSKEEKMKLLTELMTDALQE